MVQLRTRSGGSQHRDALRRSSALVRTFYRMYRPGKFAMTPEEIIPVLNDAGVKFVLMGTHGVGGWRSEPRATDDVDFLIQKRDHERAVQAVRKKFPELKEQDTPVVTRFLDPSNDQPLIDLMKPEFGVLKAVFRNSVMVAKSHRIPNLEMALASKFAAMVSPNRKQSKKLIDGGDFVNIVETNLEAIDRKKLEKLAELVYKGGGKEILDHIIDIEAGRRIHF